MRLADSGEVFGHFLIPITEEENTRQALAAAVARSTQQRARIRADLTSIAGECDLLLHLYLSDFRVVSDLQADVIDSYSLATSWIYAILYEEPNQTAPPPADLEFFIYLRVHRHYYGCYGIEGEKALLRAVRKQLAGLDQELSGRVLYSLGWPDLIVHGFLFQDIQHLRRLITSLQSLSFTTLSRDGGKKRKRKTPVFVKTITLLGVPTKLTGRRGGRPAPGDGATFPAPLLLARSRPGRTSQAIRSLSRAFAQAGAAGVTAWALDGTWDLLVMSPAQEPITLARFHDAIRRGRRGFSTMGVERTQTHLLTSREADLESLGVRTVTLQPGTDLPLLPERCRCSREDFDELRSQLEEVGPQLPRGLARTIAHALEMFRHSLRETSNCCDSVGALRAHAQGLGVLLDLAFRERKRLSRTLAADVEQQASIATELSFLNDHLVEWCKRAGRVVRERTAGSSARLFLQIDSIVAQRGPIPKILMIAERIMEDFYRRLPVQFHGGNAPKHKRFAAILEPQGNVTSPSWGLVAVPIRYAFALHLVVPQLWHEVGQYVFCAEYSPAKRERDRGESARESVDPEASLFRQKLESYRIDYELGGDMFADVLVLCFGFGGDFVNFVDYLASLTANVAKHDNHHQQLWERQALVLVHRVLFVAQFLKVHQRLSESSPRTRAEAERESRWIQDWIKEKLLAPGPRRKKAVRKIVSLLLEVAKRDGWPKQFKIPSNLEPLVSDNLETDVYARLLEDMVYLASELRGLPLPSPPAVLDRGVWEAIEAGRLVELPSGESLQSAYLEFYLEELKVQLAGRAAPPRREQFRKMATLGRSALLHIYRSEAGAP